MGHQTRELVSQSEGHGGEVADCSKAFRGLATRIAGVSLIHSEEEMHRKLEAFHGLSRVLQMMEEEEEQGGPLACLIS